MIIKLWNKLESEDKGFVKIIGSLIACILIVAGILKIIEILHYINIERGL